MLLQKTLISFLLNLGDKFSLCSQKWFLNYYVSQDGLEFSILLPQLSACWHVWALVCTTTPASIPILESVLPFY
jgi:hypothetical protein